MSLYDEVKRYGYSDYERRSEAKDYNVLDDQWLNYDLRLQQILHSDIGKITSRSQIYDPYQLVQLAMYGNDAEGQAHYNADLAAAKSFVARQEAAYQEWYDSPEQKVARERAAGRNPDLMDISGTSGAAQPNIPEGSPIQGIPTSEQIVANSISGIAGIIGSLSSVASLATAFSSFGLVDAQKDLLFSQSGLIDAQKGLIGAQSDLIPGQLSGINLSNLERLQNLLSSDISDLLATAVDKHFNSDSSDPFDYDTWFANDDNFSPLAPVYGNFDNYDTALALARKQSLRYHKNASTLQKDALAEDFNFASIAADPRLSPSQKLTAIQIRPYMSACIAADKARNDLSRYLSDYEISVKELVSKSDVAGAINASNKAIISESEYKQGYYDNVDPKLVAEFEQFLRNTQSIAYKLENRINEGYISLYDSDPDGYNGARAAFLYGSKGGHTWQDAFMLHNDANINAIIESLVAEAQATKDTAKLKALSNAMSGFNGEIYHKDPSFGWNTYFIRLQDQYKTLQKYIEFIDNN